MTILDCEDWAVDMALGAPTANIDRVDFNTSGNPAEFTAQWRNRVIQQLAVPAVVDVAVYGTYNSGTREININVEALFTSAPTAGDLRIQAIITEDSVIGTGVGFDQSNLYNTIAGHPYFGAGDPIVGFVHRHVTRKFMAGLWGTAGVIPSTPVLSIPYTQNYTYTVPSNFDENQIHIVAFVSYYDASAGNRNVLNAFEVKLDELVTTGVAQAAKNKIQVYPNPSQGFVIIEGVDSEEVLIRDALGRLLGQEIIINQQLDLTSYPEGIYFLSTVNQSQTFKIVLHR